MLLSSYERTISSVNNLPCKFIYKINKKLLFLYYQCVVLYQQYLPLFFFSTARAKLNMLDKLTFQVVTAYLTFNCIGRQAEHRYCLNGKVSYICYKKYILLSNDNHLNTFSLSSCRYECLPSPSIHHSLTTISRLRESDPTFLRIKRVTMDECSGNCCWKTSGNT